MKFLGELYTYQLLEHQIVFDVLYLLIAYGRTHESAVSLPERSESETQSENNKETTPSLAATVLANPLDSSTESWRVRLVCVLLQTCGHYFRKGITKEKLDRFLVYFQRYVLSKERISRDLCYTIDDLFDALRPRMRRFTSFEEAHAHVLYLENYEITRGSFFPARYYYFCQFITQLFLFV